MPEPRQPRTDIRFRIGVDLVSVARLTRLLEENPEAERTLFTENEIAYCNRKRRREEHLAARFAAKEAVLKAFGSGLSSRMAWTEVEIVHASLGRPSVQLHGGVADWARQHHVTDIDVSLSHTNGLAVAQALAISAALAS